ncbi:TIGR02301 family protein, partial [Methylobacterium bullatum]|nr:TIGR02301 family protein [Methylobacterium bullatum]
MLMFATLAVGMPDLASAQQRPNPARPAQKAPEKDKEPPAPSEPPPAPYDRDLMR